MDQVFTGLPPAERRAVTMLVVELERLQKIIDELMVALNDHEARIVALEP